MNFTAHGALRASLSSSALVVAAVLATGCSSSSSSSGPAAASSPSSAGGAASTSAPAPSASSGTSSSSGTSASSGASSGASGSASASSPASSPAAAGGTPECRTSDLSASVKGSQGAAGTIYYTIDFTDNNGRACTLYGYPGVSLADSSDTQIGAAARRSTTHSPSRVTLAPGGKANFALGVAEAGNYPSGTCKPKTSAYLKIYPPNQTQSMQIPFKATGCANSSVKLLSVTVLSAGATNSPG